MLVPLSSWPITSIHANTSQWPLGPLVPWTHKSWAHLLHCKEVHCNCKVDLHYQRRLNHQWPPENLWPLERFLQDEECLSLPQLPFAGNASSFYHDNDFNFRMTSISRPAPTIPEPSTKVTTAGAQNVFMGYFSRVHQWEGTWSLQAFAAKETPTSLEEVAVSHKLLQILTWTGFSYLSPQLWCQSPPQSCPAARALRKDQTSRNQEPTSLLLASRVQTKGQHLNRVIRNRVPQEHRSQHRASNHYPTEEASVKSRTLARLLRFRVPHREVHMDKEAQEVLPRKSLSFLCNSAEINV